MSTSSYHFNPLTLFRNFCTAHAVRPSDINIVAAIGDSITVRQHSSY